MSGYTARPTTESSVIALLARAVWDSTKFDHATHYLEVSLLENAIAVFEKTRLAEMKDKYIDRCAAKKDALLVLVITGEGGSNVTFMVLSLSMDVKS